MVQPGFDKSKYWTVQRQAEDKAQAKSPTEVSTPTNESTPSRAFTLPTGQAEVSDRGGAVLRYVPDVPPALSKPFLVFNCGHVRETSDKAWVIPASQVQAIYIDVKLTPVPEDGENCMDVEVSVDMFYTSPNNQALSIKQTAYGLEDGAKLYYDWTGHDFYHDYDFERED